MGLMIKIIEIHGREILDSRGNPTVEVEVTAQTETTGKKTTGRESVPSGASTGRFEAIELRDGQERYFGLGVQRVVDHINTKIRKELLGMNVLEQVQIDRKLVELDGTDNKGNLGANALLGVSLACARCAAAALDMPLYRYLGGPNAKKWPMPMMNVINGGAHAKNYLDFQEFMIMPVGARCFSEGMMQCCEIYHTLGKILKENNMSTGVGDEGGYAPSLKSDEDAIEYIIKAIEKTGYTTNEIKIALDAASSEWYSDRKYILPKRGDSLSSDELINYFDKLCSDYPIISLEDPLSEHDWDGWQNITSKIGNKVQLVGDDLFVTNTKRLKKGIELGAGNAILIKINQIGTLTETLDAIDTAHKAGYRTIISHRSGETEDTTIADIAVAVNSGQIKTGAPCRTDRVAKYNRLLRIESAIVNTSTYGI